MLDSENTRRGLMRKDDILIDTVLKDIGKLEESVKNLHYRQNEIFTQIQIEKQDHMDIRLKMENVETKLTKIERIITKIGEEQAGRSLKMQEVATTIEALTGAIERIHESLDKLNSGTHAAVHNWAEHEMKESLNKAEFRQKVYQALVTRTASGLLMILAFFLAFGLYSYVQKIPHNPNEVTISVPAVIREITPSELELD